MKAAGKIGIWLMAVGFAILLAAPVSAQEAAGGPDRLLAKTKLLYDSGKYQEAFNELVAILGQGKEKQFDAKTFAEIYRYLAFCYSAYDKRDLSKKQFKNALKYDPYLVLDPIYTSPKIMEVFGEAKLEFIKEGGMAKAEADKAARAKAAQQAAPPKEQVAQAEENDPVIIKKATGRSRGKMVSSGGTMARSIIPGWGQFYTGYKTKGYLFAGGALTSLALTLFYVKQAYTAEDYYNQASPYEKKAKYDEAKQFATYRNVFVGVTVAVWAAGCIDAYFDSRSAPRRRSGLVTPYAFHDQRGSEAGINYNVNF